jgi:hypothetical protein
MREPAALEPYLNQFHGIAIDAHIVESFSKATGMFLTRFGRPYFVDPVLNKFAAGYFNDPDKRWVTPLSSAYQIFDLAASHPNGIQANELKTHPKVGSIVAAILDYQRTRLPNLSQQAAALALLAGTSLKPLGPPEFLVAPYLFADSEAVLQTDVELAKIACKERRGGEKIYAAVAFPGDFLGSPSLLSAIERDYKQIPVDGYLLWLGDFREWKEHQALLEEYARFARRLGANGREVINLFGSYYSAILSARGLIGGSVQGVGISELRDPAATATGGGSRYYVPTAHQSVFVDVADDLQHADPKTFGCDCGRCKPGTMVRPGSLSVQDLARHFIEVRLAEFQSGEATPPSGIAARLASDATAMAKIKPPVPNVVSEFVRRLHVWEQALKTLESEGLID